MATPTTGLLPIDPAVSPQQITRILPIRANLLPSEISAGRNARRILMGVGGAIVVVIVLLGAWYAYAVGQKSDADDHLDTVTAQVDQARKRKASHTDLTETVADQKKITEDLSALVVNDLPWATTLDKVRAAGVTAEVTIGSINGALTDGDNGVAADAAGTMTITGQAKDKKTVANYVDQLAKMTGITDPYLTTATQDEESKVNFTITATISNDALCGRFTTACKTGGK